MLNRKIPALILFCDFEQNAFGAVLMNEIGQGPMVKRHVSSLLAKLDVRTHVQAAAKAVDLGLIDALRG